MTTKQLAWHQYPATIVLLLLFLWPVGLYFMWRNKVWTPVVRWAITIIVGVLLYSAFNPMF